MIINICVYVCLPNSSSCVVRTPNLGNPELNRDTLNINNQVKKVYSTEFTIQSAGYRVKLVHSTGYRVQVQDTGCKVQGAG